MKVSHQNSEIEKAYLPFPPRGELMRSDFNGGDGMNDLLRGTPYDKDPQPHELGWAFVAIAALLLGVLPSIIVGLCQ